MLLFREKVPPTGFPACSPTAGGDRGPRPLERKAATTALNSKIPRTLPGGRAEAIAIEELQHFQLVLDLLKRRGIPSPALPSRWIGGLMKSVRQGRREQAIDHLLCCALIEAGAVRNSKSSPRPP